MPFARVFAALALGVLLVGCGAGGSPSTRDGPPPRPERLVVFAGGERIGTVTRHTLRGFHMPARLTVQRGRAHLVLEIPRVRAGTAVRRALAQHASRLDLPIVHLRTTISLRPVRQVLRDDCEATALSMILAAAGVQAGQLELQARLPRSGPLDPEPVAGSRLFRWGDPEKGFVGRADGGGPDGGFGVYEPPIRALASRYGVRLADLRGSTLDRIRAALLSGRPVLAWVGLTAGPYSTWLTPSGQEITVDFGEHAVVLVGAGPGYVLVNDPLSGSRVRWGDALFDVRWRRLGRRALELR